MTELEVRALRWIADFIDRAGIAPSYAEIGAEIGVSSKSSVSRIVRNLTKGGHLLRSRGSKVRNLRLPGVDLRSVPTATLQRELARRSTDAR